MRNEFGLPQHIIDATRAAQEHVKAFDAMRAQAGLWETSIVRDAFEQARRADEIRRLAFPDTDLMARFRDHSATMQLQRQMALDRKLFVEPMLFDRFHEVARLAQSSQLPLGLDSFRTSTDILAAKLQCLPDLEWVRHADHLAAFSNASAVSDLVAQSMRVSADLRAATQAFATSVIPNFETLAGYRQFLDAAGMSLPRWPKLRLLTAADKRRKLKAKLKLNAEPTHVKRAKSLVHRYELTLREILDSVMADAYGEDWAEARLPLCDCKDLLSRWRKRGGEVLDHADYAHYERIMSHPEHFEAVFEAGFDDPAALADLMKQAGRLRAASHHAHEFTLEDLRDLRLTWRTIESGLLAFTPDYEVEAWN